MRCADAGFAVFGPSARRGPDRELARRSATRSPTAAGVRMAAGPGVRAGRIRRRRLAFAIGPRRGRRGSSSRPTGSRPARASRSATSARRGRASWRRCSAQAGRRCRRRGAAGRAARRASSRCATADARSRCRSRATTSGSATATRARTPAGWAPIARSRTCRTTRPTRSSTAFHRPILAELARRGTPFRGALYAGLMLTADGPRPARVQRPLRRPRDAGRSCRGSPSPLGPLLLAAARGGRLGRAPRRGCRGRCRARPSRIVLAAAGYPGAPRPRRPDRRARRRRATGALVFHAGDRARRRRAVRDGRRARPDRRRARRRTSAAAREAAERAADAIRGAGAPAAPRHRARPPERGRRGRSGPMIPRYTLARDGRDLDRAGPVRGDAPRRARGRPRPGGARRSSRRRRSPRSRRAPASMSSGSPRSSGRPTTTSSPSSARSPRRSGPRVATSTSG